LLSKTPLHLIQAFSSFSPTTHTKAIERSRLFETAVKNLISYWYTSFKPNPTIASLVSKTYAEAINDGIYSLAEDPKAAGEIHTGKGPIPGETIRSAQSLMKRALNMSASQDLSAQLFVSLCRSLGIGARLVISLQPLNWRAAGNSLLTDPTEEEEEEDEKEGKKSKGKGKKKEGLPKSKVAKKPKTGISKLAKRAGIATSDFKWDNTQRRSITGNRSTTATATEDSEEVEMEAVLPSSSKGKGKATRPGSSSRPVSVASDAESMAGGYMKGTTDEDRRARRALFLLCD